MKLDSISLYIEKTLVVGIGDKITNCRIGGGKGLNVLVSIPKETVDSGNYKVEFSKVNQDAVKSEFQFIYVG